MGVWTYRVDSEVVGMWFMMALYSVKWEIALEKYVARTRRISL